MPLRTIIFQGTKQSAFVTTAAISLSATWGENATFFFYSLLGSFTSQPKVFQKTWLFTLYIGLALNLFLRFSWMGCFAALYIHINITLMWLLKWILWQTERYGYTSKRHIKAAKLTYFHLFSKQLVFLAKKIKDSLDHPFACDPLNRPALIKLSLKFLRVAS